MSRKERKYTYWPKLSEQPAMVHVRDKKRDQILNQKEYIWLKNRLRNTGVHWTHIAICGFALWDAWCKEKNTIIMMDMPRSEEQLTTEKEACPPRHLFIVKPFDDVALQTALSSIAKLPKLLYGKPIEQDRD